MLSQSHWRCCPKQISHGVIARGPDAPALVVLSLERNDCARLVRDASARHCAGPMLTEGAVHARSALAWLRRGRCNGLPEFTLAANAVTDSH
eukprot:15483567-Alexandrium_andersonii.AAC.1